MAFDITSNLVFHMLGGDRQSTTRMRAKVGADGTFVGASDTIGTTVEGPGDPFRRVTTLNGTTQYVNCGNAANLQPAGSVSVSILARHTNWAAGVAPMFLAKSAGTTATIAYELRMFAGQSKPQFLVSNGTVLNTATATNALTNGLWYQFGGVYNGSTVSIYVNGLLAAPAVALTGVPAVTTESLAIGCRKPTAAEFFFGGQWADARVYTRALAAADMLALADYRRAARGRNATHGRSVASSR
jgi:hypothetical protein